MGCDIHMHGEVKIGGTWHHFGDFDGSRRYGLFAKMANVRNYGDIEPIAEPRGLPKDVNFLTKFDSDKLGVDGHSHSWLGLDEIKTLIKWWTELAENEKSKEDAYDCFGEFFGRSFYWLITDDLEELKETGIEDIRIVFWFDN